MLIPSTFRKVNKGDYSIAPFIVSKRFVISEQDAISLGYSVKTANYQRATLAVSASKNSVVNAPTSSDGTYNSINWKSLNHIHYRNPYSYAESYEGVNQNVTEKNLYTTASYISCPYYDMGEGIKPSTVTLISDNLNLSDDGHYNFYDVDILETPLEDYLLDGYWGFNKTFLIGGTNDVSFVDDFVSNTLPNDHGKSTFNRVNITEGIEINSTGSGHQIDFTEVGSNVIASNEEQFNYELEEDYTISFWVQAPVSQSVVTHTSNNIINKRYIKDVITSKIFTTTNDRGQSIRRRIQSSSVEYRPTNIYPYDFSIYNQTSGYSGNILFRVSDGTATTAISSSTQINDGTHHHICTVKTGSNVYLYVDGNLESSSSVATMKQPTNDRYVVFGAQSLDGIRQYSGSLDEVRFYNRAFSSSEVSTSLANNSNQIAYQTKNVGNVFYKRGEVVITSPVKKYHDYFDQDNWSLTYNNTYTIYEYEAMVRIKACEFNRTMNHSAKVSPKSDLYMPEMISGSLTPYATTIGLYNDRFELVAVAKMGRPLKMRPDVDLNVNIRLDY